MATDQAIAESVQINRHAAGGSVNVWYYRRQPAAWLTALCRWSAAVGPRARPGGGAALVYLAADLRGVATGLTSITLPNMCRWTEVASAAASRAGPADRRSCQGHGVDGHTTRGA